MPKKGRVVLLIVSLLVLAAMIFFVRKGIFGKTEKVELKVEATALADPRQCQVTVTIDRPPSDVDLSVSVTAKPGIYFRDGNEGVSTIKRDVGTVFPREVRILTFNCFFGPTTTLHSGAYMVKAVAKHRSPKADEGKDYATGKTPLFVELKPDLTNVFLPGKAEFDALFSQPYEQGVYYQYKLDLAPDEESKPKSGMLHVRINSQADNFSLTLYVVVSGGVAFGQQASFDSDFIENLEAALVNIRASGIDAGGSRIVSIPFSVIPQAIPGSYGVKVLQAGQGERPGEMAPLYIGVTNSAESPGELWLTLDKRTDAPLLTPAPTRAQ